MSRRACTELASIYVQRQQVQQIMSKNIKCSEMQQVLEIWSAKLRAYPSLRFNFFIAGRKFVPLDSSELHRQIATVVTAILEVFPIVN
jgi:hypothetical protein